MNENMNAYVIIKYILLQQNWKTIKNSETAELNWTANEVRMYEVRMYEKYEMYEVCMCLI
jgi:hypothetical protein